MINLVAQQLFHRVNDPVTPGNGAEHIVAGLVPEHEFGNATFSVLAIIGVLCESLIGSRRLAKNAGLFLIE
jgi:hypothetical protein